MDRIKEILKTLQAIEYLEVYDGRLINNNVELVKSIKQQYIEDALLLVEDQIDEDESLPF